MSIIGVRLDSDSMVLTTGRDFKWSFENLDGSNLPINFPAGGLFFELDTAPTKTLWTFVVDGSTATLKIESEVADLIPRGTRWQLVFLPEGEVSGGDPIALGSIYRQG